MRAPEGWRIQQNRQEEAKMTSKERKETDKDKVGKERPKRESKDYLGAEGTISGQGREGGRLARDIGTRDELKRARERPGGKTRVRKSDEKDDEN